MTPSMLWEADRSSEETFHAKLAIATQRDLPVEAQLDPVAPNLATQWHQWNFQRSSPLEFLPLYWLSLHKVEKLGSSG